MVLAFGTGRQRSRFLLMAIFIAAISFVFSEAVSVMFNSWQSEEYSYGYLVPVVSLVLLLNKIEDKKLTPRSSWWGFVIVLLAILAQFVLRMAAIRGVLPEVYLIAVIGVVIAFVGTKAARKLAGALAFLMFAAPLPIFFYYALSFNMQMLSTSLGVKLLELLSIPVFQDGNIIDLGGYRLQVAEACSGLRYLFPLMSLSFLLAYMYRSSGIKRLILFLSAIPITVLLNSLRIGIIGVTVDHWGQRMAEGFIHQAEGWVVFAACTVCLLMEVWVFQRIGRKGVLRFDCLRMPKLFRSSVRGDTAPLYGCAVVILFGLFINIVMPTVLNRAIKPVPLRQSFAVFPLQVGPWIGHFGTLDAASLAILGTEDYLMADYTKPDSQPVNLYALYYSHQDGMSNEAIHTPFVCIPAGGWAIDSQVQKTINLSSGAPFTVNRVIASKGPERQLVYYWFIQGGRAMWDQTNSKLYQMENAVLHGTTNGAIVRYATKIQPSETEADADKRLMDFLQVSIGQLDDFMFPASSIAGSPAQ